MDVLIVHCNIINNNYQQDSTVLYTFAPNISFGQLLGISSNSLISLKSINSKFSSFKVWFMDQNLNR